MSLQAATVMVDCADPSTLAAWYVDVLGGEVVADHGDIVITRVGGMPMNLGFQRVPEAKTTKSRAHVDYLAADRDAEVQRLVDAGATAVGDHSLGGFAWTVLQDPQGTELCIAQAPPSAVADTDETSMPDTRAEERAAIEAVLEDSYTAWTNGDADGMVACYTPDATAIMPGSLRGSREEIRESMALAFAGPLKGTTTYNKPLSVRFVGHDAAIVISEAAILFPGQSEVPEGAKVSCTWVLEKRDGQWLVAAYHNSPLVAPAR